MPYSDPEARRKYHLEYMARYHAEGRSGRKKPEMFMTCEEGRHSRCAMVVTLAGNIAFRCKCACHAGGSDGKDS